MSVENHSDLFEHYDFTASSGQTPLRVDKFLMNFIENASRNKIQKAAQSGNILVNNQSVKSSHKVKAGDKVSVVYSYPKQTNELKEFPLRHFPAVYVILILPSVCKASSTIFESRSNM